MGSSGIVNATIKPEDKKTADAPRVEVIEYRISKISEGLGNDYGTIKITGKAVFIPSQENEVFKDLIGRPVFNLLDINGNKVMEFRGSFKCGEYGNEENIVSQKSFPFIALKAASSEPSRAMMHFRVFSSTPSQ